MKSSLAILAALCIVVVSVSFGWSSFSKAEPKHAREDRNSASVYGALPSQRESMDAVRVPPTDPQKVIILTYHSIEPKPNHKEGASQRHYRITPENFEEQMKYLKDNNYQPITFKSLVDYLSKGIAIPKNAVVITFDDGWKSQYTYALPVLKKYGFTATFFIVSKSRNGGYMTWDEVRALANDAFEIGSHTETHAKLATLLDDAALERELVGSKKTLEDHIGMPVWTLAYPYYNHDERVMQAVRKAGYAAARAGWGKGPNNNDRIYELVSQEAVDNPNPFASKIK